MVLIPNEFWLNEIVIQSNDVNQDLLSSPKNNVNIAQTQSFSKFYWVWILGSIWMFCSFLLKMNQLRILKKKSIVMVLKDQKIQILPNSAMAFSFLNQIYIGALVPAENLNTLVKHEQIHIQQKHSYDLLLLEILKIVFWWNPMMYWFQSRLVEIHEFLVDAHFKNKANYYQKLLQTLFEVPNFNFANSFFSPSLIKTRMNMLHKKSNPRKSWRYAMVLPVIALMLFLNCTQEAIVEPKVEPNANLSEKERIDFYVKSANLKKAQGVSYQDQLKIVKQEYKKNAERDLELHLLALYTLIAIDEQTQYRRVEDYTNDASNAIPFASVSTYPVYENADPTDIEFFQNYIQKHIRENFVYPNEAMDAGIQGRVFVSFTIDEFGEININGVRGPSPILEDAVHELMLKLPKASAPATKDGKPVDMNMSIPVTFKLN
jgi:TonB family protein